MEESSPPRPVVSLVFGDDGACRVESGLRDERGGGGRDRGAGKLNTRQPLVVVTTLAASVGVPPGGRGQPRQRVVDCRAHVVPALDPGDQRASRVAVVVARVAGVFLPPPWHLACDEGDRARFRLIVRANDCE